MLQWFEAMDAGKTLEHCRDRSLRSVSAFPFGIGHGQGQSLRLYSWIAEKGKELEWNEARFVKAYIDRL